MVFTLSVAGLKWPDMIQTIAQWYGASYTDEEVAILSFEDKSNWLKRTLLLPPDISSTGSIPFSRP